MAWSYILDFENNSNPFIERKIEIQLWKEIAAKFIAETPGIISEMNRLTSVGFKSLDALHISCAKGLNCDYFLTVDKGILKKSNSVSNIEIDNPVNFVLNREEKK